MSIEMIPVVDLRLLSQAELNSLSLSSSTAFDPHRSDDIVVPKIDRSVFNESAGSRKQTYSRLRLAPRKSDLSSPSSSSSVASGGRRSRRRSGGLLPVPSTPAPAVVDDPGRRENKQIVLFLRQLFAKGSSKPLISTQTGGGSTTVPNPTSSNPNPKTPNADPSPSPYFNLNSTQRKRGRKKARIDEEVVRVSNAERRDSDVVNINGVEIDLIGLGKKQDLFSEELRRMTKGLVSEEEFLGFLRGLDGQWGSRRKKRKIVDAGVFGDGLPRGWKILLGLKRKEGNVWLHCRRYISPNGKQFASCMEVSSYLLSLVGPEQSRQPISGPGDESTPRAEKRGYLAGLAHQEGGIKKEISSYSSVTPISSVSADSQKQYLLHTVENPVKVQLQSLLECQKCSLTFTDKDSHVQHLLTFHQSAKSCRLGKSIGDGVIIKDGKYECQFCHKMFSERHRYNGHVGVHVRNYTQSLEALPDKIIMEKIDNPSVMNISNDKKDEINSAEEICTAIPFSESNTVSPCNKQHINIRESDCYPNCSAPETTHDTSSESADNLINGYDILNQKLQKASEISNAMNVELDACDTSPSPMVVDNTTCETFIEKGLSASATIDETERSNGEQKMGFESHSSTLSGSGQTYTEKVHLTSTMIDETENCIHDQKLGSEDHWCMSGNEQTYFVETDRNKIFTSIINKREVVEMDKSGNERESGPRSSEVILDKDAVADNISNEIDISDNKQERVLEKGVSASGQNYNVKDLLANTMIDEIEKASSEQKIDSESFLSTQSGSGQSYVVEANSNGTFTCTMKKHELIEMDKSITEQKISLRSGEVVSDRDVVAENTASHDIDMSDNGLERDEKGLSAGGQPFTENKFSARTMINEIEKFSSEQKIDSERHLSTLSGSEHTVVVENNGNDTLTCIMEKHELFEMDKSINEQERCFGSGKVVFDRNVVTENAMHDKIDISVNDQERNLESCIIISSGSDHARVIESYMNGMSPNNMKESVLGEMDESVNVLESGLGVDCAGSLEDAARDPLEIAERTDDLQSLVVTTPSSWVESSACLPTLNLLSNQGEDGLGSVNQKSENIAGFEELRSGCEADMDLSYNADIELGFGPSVQLEWEVALPDMVSSRQLTTVCVWCSMEFSYEGMNAEVPSDSVGYMCPTCKSKISGQIHVPYDGLSEN